MKKRSWRKKLLGMAGACMLVSGCSRRPEASLNRYDAQFLGVFDTVTSMVGYAEDEDTFTDYAQELKQELETYHKLYDIYHEYEGMNNLKTINDQAGVEPVKVDEKIIDMLGEAIEMYGQTGGKVNIAMGSVLSVWHDYREAGLADPEHASLPSMEELKAAAEHMDITKVQIDHENSTVYLADPDMSLDVGAIGKGYAAEMACKKLKEEGLQNALVSVGGNVRAIGAKAGGEKWKVGIQNPDLSSEEQYLYRLEIEDMSLVTSGTYQRFYQVEGKRYHHIINPDTLTPWDRYESVSILCEDSGLADALSTAVFNMEPEEGKALVESLEGVEALWLYPDGTELSTSGFFDYLAEEDKGN